MKRKFATALLVFNLAMPVPAAADAFGDMFSFMFRMMLTMMNVMSDVVNDDNSGWGNNWGGWPNTYMPFSSGMGMGAWPMMSGMYSPTGWSGINPWSGTSGFPMSPGLSPWGSGWNQPWQGGYNPVYPPAYGMPVNRSYPYGRYPGAGISLLDGRWFGTHGEVLEIRGNRFRLQDEQTTINGAVRISNNIVSLFSPQTGTVTQYTFVRNQSELVLQDASGQILAFQSRPTNRGPVHTF